MAGLLCASTAHHREPAIAMARLRRINPPESDLSPSRYHVVVCHPRSRRPHMTDFPAGAPRRPWFKKSRAAALSFGLGATLALSPLVWAQNPPAPSEPAPPATGLLPQQSFAPLVKRVLPAVVN